MNDNSIKQSSLTGFMWKLFEKFGSYFMGMVVQIILARLLLPEDYGIIGYLTLFTTLSDVFLKQGFTTALIQKKDADDTDFSTVFFANIVMSVLIYLLFYLIAPYVALFYHEPRLTTVMRVFCLNVVIGSLSSVHEAIMAKNLEFKKSFIRGLSVTFSYGVCGVTLALLGFGVWSLVYCRLVGVAVGVVVYWLTVKWMPHKIFSFERLKKLFSFSSRVLGTNLLNTVYNNVNSLLIGRFYKSADLGFYQRGQNIPQTVMVSIDGSMTEVMYPTFSKLQSNLEQLKSALRRSMKLSMYVVFPVLVGMMVVSKPLTLFLLTEKWLPSVPYMQLTCMICMFWPLSQRTNGLNALGKSKTTFRLSLVAKAVSLVFILIFVRFGVIYIMIGTLLSSFINFFITSAIVKKHLNYSVTELLKDIGPSLILAVVMGVIVYSVMLLNLGNFVTLVIQGLLGVGIYVGGSVLFKIDSFYYILNIVKENFINKIKAKI